MINQNYFAGKGAPESETCKVRHHSFSHSQHKTDNNDILISISIVVKRCHGHSNSYKEKDLIVSGLQTQRLHPLSSWYHRYVAGKEVENSISRFICSRKR